MPDGIIGYYDPVSNRVAMYEQSKLAETAPSLAINQCISTVVHEGVHQILHNIGVQPRMSEWPKWLSEGLAEYCSPTKTGDQIRWEGVGEVNHLRMHSLLKRLEKQDERFDDGQLLRRVVAAKDLDSDGYAAAWALTYYLINNRQTAYFEHLRAVARQFQPFAMHQPDNTEIFVQHFGDDWDQLQNEMLASVKKLPYVDPIMNQPHYVAVLETRLWRKVLITTSPKAVHEWQDEEISGLAPRQRDSSRFHVQVVGNRQEAEKTADKLLR
jgi:hypothetical protein